MLYDDLNEDFDDGITNIGSQNTIHDRSQFESKFDYDLHIHGGQQKHYEVDMYFFIPKNLGIDSESYRREDFYTNLTNYLRISNSSSSHQLKASDISLPFLDKYIGVHLITQKRQKLACAVVQETQMFGNRFNSRLKRLSKNLVRILQKKNFLQGSAQADFIKKQITEIDTIINLYRERYASYAWQQKIFLDEEVKRVLMLIDEYCSYRLELALIKVYRHLDEHQKDFAESLTIIENILRKETKYREQMGLINIDTSNDSGREYYYYRMGLLKKYVSSALFLEVNNLKKEKTYRNIIAAIGAALAGTWASLSNVQYWQLMSTKQHINFQLFTIVIIGIVAYIFKDRIKEWTKDYFNEQLKHRIPDFDRKMFYTQYNGQGEAKRYFLGSTREFMRYLKKSAIPEEVTYIRDMGITTELEPKKDEVILHYSKKLYFDLEKINNKLYHIEAIKNLMRFDVSKFLTKLDEREKSLYYFDRKNGITSIEAPKVYHINIVFRYLVNIQNTERETQNIEFERIRIVLNKKRIVRVEEVIKRGEMKYSEEKKKIWIR